MTPCRVGDVLLFVRGLEAGLEAAAIQCGYQLQVLESLDHNLQPPATWLPSGAQQRAGLPVQRRVCELRGLRGGAALPVLSRHRLHPRPCPRHMFDGTTADAAERWVRKWLRRANVRDDNKTAEEDARLASTTGRKLLYFDVPHRGPYACYTRATVYRALWRRYRTPVRPAHAPTSPHHPLSSPQVPAPHSVASVLTHRLADTTAWQNTGWDKDSRPQVPISASDDTASQVATINNNLRRRTVRVAPCVCMCACERVPCAPRVDSWLPVAARPQPESVFFPADRSRLVHRLLRTAMWIDGEAPSFAEQSVHHDGKQLRADVTEATYELHP